jgi:hypothetical protein
VTIVSDIRVRDERHDRTGLGYLIIGALLALFVYWMVMGAWQPQPRQPTITASQPVTTAQPAAAAAAVERFPIHKCTIFPFAKWPAGCEWAVVYDPDGDRLWANAAAKAAAEAERNNPARVEPEACLAAVEAVKARLKAPSTASFAWCGWGMNVAIEPKKVSVTGYVDAQNSFGAMLRNRFVVILDRTPTGLSVRRVSIQ